jgi:hypothetical protein
MEHGSQQEKAVSVARLAKAVDAAGPASTSS